MSQTVVRANCLECGKRFPWDRTMYQLCDRHVSDELIDKFYPRTEEAKRAVFARL